MRTACAMCGPLWTYASGLLLRIEDVRRTFKVYARTCVIIYIVYIHTYIYIYIDYVSLHMDT